MMSDNYWKERFYSLKRWVEQQPNISEASEKDWEDFWYRSITLPTLEEVWNEMEGIEPLTPIIKGETNGIK
jgi:hypothetical protein